MQSLSDDERKALLGEVLADEIHAMYQYMRDMGRTKQQAAAAFDQTEKHEGRLNVLEHVVCDHETDIKQLRTDYKQV